MTPAQLKSLIKTLKAAGVTEFQHGDLKLTLGVKPAETPKEPTPVDAPTESNEPIKHKVEEMTSLLKLSDVDLVERLFPDTEAKEEESA